MGAALRTLHHKRQKRKIRRRHCGELENVVSPVVFDGRLIRNHEVQVVAHRGDSIEQMMDLEITSGIPLTQIRRLSPLNIFSEGEPGPRSGHRMVANESDLFVIGGYSPSNNLENQLFKECWRFNLFARSWQRLQTSGPMPDELASHAALLHGHYLLVHGGTATPFGQRKSNKLHLLDLRSLTWRHLQCNPSSSEEDVPPPIYGHSLNLVPFPDGTNFLYLMGGTGGWDYSMDIYRINTTSWSWQKVKPQTMDGSVAEPGPRYRHETIFYERRLWVFGGGTNDTAYGFQEIHVFDVDSACWMQLSASSAEPQTESQRFPAPRRCHSCVLFEDQVLLCGGFDGTTIFEGVWMLHLPTVCWRRLGSWPQPAYFHGAAATPYGQVFLFGGVDQIEQRRSKALFCCTFPKTLRLDELAWLALKPALRDSLQRGELTFEQARRCGVPTNYLDRIPPAMCPVELNPNPCGAA